MRSGGQDGFLCFSFFFESYPFCSDYPGTEPLNKRLIFKSPLRYCFLGSPRGDAIYLNLPTLNLFIPRGDRKLDPERIMLHSCLILFISSFEAVSYVAWVALNSYEAKDGLELHFPSAGIIRKHYYSWFYYLF